MSLVDEQWAFLQDFAKLVEYARQKGMVLTGGELWRTPEQQQLYYNQGKSRTLKSNHLVKCAIDLNIIKDGKLSSSRDDYSILGAYWESLSPKNKWGGHFNGFIDMPHFERNP